MISVIFSMVLGLAACGNSSTGAAGTTAAGNAAAGSAAESKAAGGAAGAEVKAEEEKGGIEGAYIPVVGEMFGVALVGEELEGFSLELQKGGKGKMAVDGSSANAKWKDNGDGTLTVTVEGKDMTASIGEDCLVFDDLLEMGLKLTFAKEGTPAADPALYLPESDKKLIGDWQSVSVVDIIGDPVDSSEMTADALQMSFKGDHTLDGVIAGEEFKGYKWSNMGDYGSVDEEDQNISWKPKDDGLEVDFKYKDEFYTFFCLQGDAAKEALKALETEAETKEEETETETEEEAEGAKEPAGSSGSLANAAAGAGAGAASAPSFKESTTTSIYGPYWDRDWYGWYQLESCTGEYENLDYEWWDVCGAIYVHDDDTGKVYLWDEDGDVDNPMCIVDVTFGPGTTDAGCMKSESGSFWASEPNIEHADWLVDPGASHVSDYEHMIWIEGTYEDETGSFRYNMYLRPWGMDWEDVRSDDADMMPRNYDSWYVNVKDEPMPDKIG